MRQTIHFSIDVFSCFLGSLLIGLALLLGVWLKGVGVGCVDAGLPGWTGGRSNGLVG